jgi:acyl carrier protein
MIPSAFVFLDKLPVVPNGRIDRRALPVPNRVRPALAYDYTEPRTAVESYLANLWAEVLNLEQVGIHDQFLHLGGHSLLATKIISRVAQNFGVKLPVRSLFQTTTIAKLALLIARTQVVASEADTVSYLLAELETLSDEETGAQPGGINGSDHD